MRLTEIKAEIAATAADAANDLLLEQGFDAWNIFEDVLANRAWVAGIFPSETNVRQKWERLAEQLAQHGVAPLGEPVVRELADEDWRDSYKAHFKPWSFGRLHWVPIWQRNTYELPPGDAALWLDPGLAFGTGNHETTRLCVERLVAIAEEHGTAARVIDAGCGSGILALSAARLGFKEAIGFDNDPEAVRVSEENAALNGLAEQVRFFTADIAQGLASRDAGIVLANIQADVLMRFARELVGAVVPGGTLVLSGILSAENAAVRTAFEDAAPDWIVNARTIGEWSDVVLTRPR